MTKVKLTKKNIIISSSILAVLLIGVFGSMIYFSSSQAVFQGDIIECYQEQADTTSICGGLGGGYYDDIKDSNDGDWLTSTKFKNTEEEYFEYEVPNNTVGAYIKVKLEDDNGNIMNIERQIPSECIKQFIEIEMNYDGGSQGTYEIYCFDASNQGVSIYDFYNGKNGRLYEDAMIWEIREETDCWTINAGTCSNTPTLLCNGGYQSISDCELYLEMNGLFNITPIDLSELQNQVDDIDAEQVSQGILISEAQQDIIETDAKVWNNTQGVEENKNNILFFFAGLFGLNDRVTQNEYDIANNTILINANSGLIQANALAIAQNGLNISNNGDLINANGLLIGDNGDRIDANELLIDANGNLITANGLAITNNGFLIANNTNLIDANGNEINAQGLRITDNENGIIALWNAIWGIGDTLEASMNYTDSQIGIVNNQMSQIEYDAEQRDIATNGRIDEAELRITENEETIAEILLSLFRLDGILGSQCWMVDENYCVRDTVSETCTTFTSKRACQETITCWEIQGDNCYDSHSSDCSGFTTEALCIAEIPEPTTPTYTYTTIEATQVSEDMRYAYATGNYTGVEDRVPLIESIVTFWNGFWN